uniref:Uncharacterized protein n=1 Tax=viral metagenome TaxID=1070528 RepID=A0A6H2A6L4_9ZZZZ
MSDKPKDFGVICEHGSLKRKCDSCALIACERKLDAAEAEIARLREREKELTEANERLWIALRKVGVLKEADHD